MDNLLKQYEIDVPFEFIEDAVGEIAEVMKIKINYEEIDKAIETKDRNNEDNICIFCDKNDNRNLIIVDCTDSTFYGILVRCYGNICEKVKDKMLEVDTKLRKMLSEETYDELENTISNSKNAIYFITERYKNLKIPGVNS